MGQRSNHHKANSFLSLPLVVCPSKALKLCPSVFPTHTPYPETRVNKSLSKKASRLQNLQIVSRTGSLWRLANPPLFAVRTFARDLAFSAPSHRLQAACANRSMALMIAQCLLLPQAAMRLPVVNSPLPRPPGYHLLHQIDPRYTISMRRQYHICPLSLISTRLQVLLKQKSTLCHQSRQWK